MINNEDLFNEVLLGFYHFLDNFPGTRESKWLAFQHMLDEDPWNIALYYSLDLITDIEGSYEICYSKEFKIELNALIEDFLNNL